MKKVGVTMGTSHVGARRPGFNSKFPERDGGIQKA